MATCALCSDEYRLCSRSAGYELCQRCWSKDTLREYDRLESAKHKVQSSGLTATLGKWLGIAADWRGLCAYCQEAYYSAIDLYRPGEGLTATNCVPTCKVCTVHKNRGGFTTMMDRMQAYLMTPPSAQLVPGGEL